MQMINLYHEISEAYISARESIAQACDFAEIGNNQCNISIGMEQLPWSRILRESSPDMSPSDWSVVLDKSVEDQKYDFSEYCSRYAVVAAIVACEVFLQRFFVIAQIASIAKNSPIMTAGELREKIRIAQKSAEDLGVRELPNKIFKQLENVEVPQPVTEWFHTIYRLRKCLVHRRGIVGEKDINKSTKYLEVKWGKPIPITETKVGDSFIPLGNSRVMSYKAETSCCKWSQGDQIRLSVENCEEISASLLLFCMRFTEEMDRYLQTINLPDSRN